MTLLTRKSPRCECLSVILCYALVLGCSQPEPPQQSITLATTTSTQDSGLLDVLIPMFERQTGIEVKVVAVGTGQALEMGRRGDADVLLTHAPAAEEAFMAEGFGTERRSVMANDFVLVGPSADPATVAGEKSIVAAVAKIADNSATFISRGDESGTHMKEKLIWQEAKIEPNGSWYLKSGTGMGQTLRIASEKAAYTLTDRATYLSQKDGLELVILSEGGPILLNPYAVIPINPEKHPHINHDSAAAFADFLVTPESRQSIAEFGLDKFGQPLFFPDEPAKHR